MRRRVQPVADPLDGRSIVERGFKAGAARFWRNRSPGRSGRYTRAEQRCGHLSRDFRVIARGLERRNVPYTDWRGAAANRSLRAAVSPYKLVTRFIGAPLLLSRSEPVAWAFGRIVLHQILCRCYAVDIRPPDRLSQIGVLKTEKACGSTNSTTTWSCSTTSPTALSPCKSMIGS